MRFLKRPVNSIQIPNIGDSYILIGSDVPQQLKFFTLLSGVFTTAAVVIYQSGQGTSRFIAIRDDAVTSSLTFIIEGYTEGLTTYITGRNAALGGSALVVLGNPAGIVVSDGNGNAVVDALYEIYYPPFSATQFDNALLQMTNSSILAVESSSEITVIGDTIVGSITSSYIASVNPGGSRSTATFANMPSPIASVSIDKKYTATNLKVTMDGTFVQSSGNTGFETAVLISGTDTVMSRYAFTAGALLRESYSNTRIITGVSAGTVTVQPRWRPLNTTAINVDANDYFSIVVEEVAS